MGRRKKGWGERVDKNDPLNYVGTDDKGRPYKFMESDGYQNNIYTELHKKPKAFPLDNDWKSLVGSSYHKTTWIPADNERDDAMSRRRLDRDPNHPIWRPRYGLLRWWHIRISLLGSDPEGRQWISIRKGQSEPIFIRFGRLVEVFYKGKKLSLEE